MKDTMFSGTKGKYRIEIESPGFDMVRDEFEITLKQGTKSVNYDKADLIDRVIVVGGVEKHEYYFTFNTDPSVSPYFSPAGDIIVVVKAYVPDEDFGTNGIRTEVDRFRLVNVQPV